MPSQVHSKAAPSSEGGNSWECTWDAPTDSQGQPTFNSAAEAAEYAGEDASLDPEEDLPDGCAAAVLFESEEEVAVRGLQLGNPDWDDQCTSQGETHFGSEAEARGYGSRPEDEGR